jgi:hypothetical protein
MKPAKIRSWILMLAVTLVFAWGAHAGKAADAPTPHPPPAPPPPHGKPCQKFPATGQTTCWDSSAPPNVISCAGTGQDGDIRAGAPLSYTDNGDGTITDRNTRLMWEKKSDDGSIHDKVSVYTWADAFAVHVVTLNQINFAGHTDWRLPNVRELQSIVDFENFSPAIAPAFNTGCVPGATVLTGSCTPAVSAASPGAVYWSSTTAWANSPAAAWVVAFATGDTYHEFKVYLNAMHHVRAVRG